jgi:short subunit dehydrogenase-like uncharacterized protein
VSPRKRENHPVVLYGASGFSGRLVAEFLREYKLPFVAAGRNKARIEDVLAHVPGISTATYEVVEVEHEVDKLAAVFAGARVVCNATGPCFRYASTVVEAALKAGCHYLDTGGETPWVRRCREEFSERFAQHDLLLAPATAYMSATAEIAARIAIERHPGIDTLEVLSMFKGNPSYGSTQTVYGQLVFESVYLEDNEYREWPPLTVLDVTIPGSITTHQALPWGGFPHPVWFKDHPQIANVRSFGGILDPVVMQGVIAGERDYQEKLKPLPLADQEKILSELAAAAQSATPPRENRRENRTVDVVMGRGNLETAHVVITGAGAYLQTGLIQAFAAHHLAHRPPAKTGFASPGEAFGHLNVLAALEAYGFVRLQVIN